jgi:hypothetical protein
MAMSSQQVRSGANAINDHFQKVWAAQGVWDAGSIADGDEAVETLTVTGVALGDVVLGVSASVDVADLVLSAAVTAANEVTVSLANNTGGAVDLASATYRVVVARIADFPENANA